MVLSFYGVHPPWDMDKICTNNLERAVKKKYTFVNKIHAEHLCEAVLCISPSNLNLICLYEWYNPCYKKWKIFFLEGNGCRVSFRKGRGDGRASALNWEGESYTETPLFKKEKGSANKSISGEVYCKKVSVFPSLAGMALTKLSVWLVTSRLGTGKSLTICTVHGKQPKSLIYNNPLLCTFSPCKFTYLLP